MAKLLMNDEIIFMLEHCEIGRVSTDNGFICDNCPLEEECFYYYTGEKCDSALEKDDEDEEDE